MERCPRDAGRRETDLVGADLCELEPAGIGWNGGQTERARARNNVGLPATGWELHVVDHAAVQRVLLDHWRPMSGQLGRFTWVSC